MFSNDYIITSEGLVSVDYLKHHGVKGMKWGVRKAHKNTVSTSNKSRSKTEDPSNETSKKKGLSAKQKRTLKIGAAVVGIVLAAHSAYKVSGALKDKAYKKAYERGTEATRKYMMKINRDKLPYIRDTLDNGHTDHANMMLKNLDRISDKLHTDDIKYANRNSKTTTQAVKTLLGKNREFTIAELLDMGIKVNGYN